MSKLAVILTLRYFLSSSLSLSLLHTPQVARAATAGALSQGRTATSPDPSAGDPQPAQLLQGLHALSTPTEDGKRTHYGLSAFCLSLRIYFIDFYFLLLPPMPYDFGKKSLSFFL